MADSLDLGGISVSYKLIDIRDHTVEELLATGHPADYVLAMLARDGVERLREILEKVLRLPGEERRRVLARMASLAGLRGAAEVLKMEVDDMGSFITLEDNVILRDIHDAAIATGRAEGMTRILRRQIEQRFGPLPEWAESRIQSAGTADLERWASNVISAPDLKSALDQS